MPDDTAAVTATSPAPGPLSTWLSQQGFDHAVLPPDHLGVEVINSSQSIEAVKDKLEHLTSRCQGWTDDMVRQRGWAPEVA